jgi:hypothetical protein
MERFDHSDPLEFDTYYTLKRDLEMSRPGGYIIIEFVDDVLVVVIACPFTLDEHIFPNKLV